MRVAKTLSILVAIGLAGCGGHEAASEVAEASAEIRTASSIGKHGSEQVPLHLTNCKLHAGGHNVQAHGLSCEKAAALVLVLSVRDLNAIQTPVNDRPGASREVVFRDQGWTCWASYVEVGNGGPSSGIKHVCSRGPQLLQFTFG